MNKSEPYFLDDKVIIPDDIKKMSKEQLRHEIIRLEKEAKEKRIRNQKIATMA